MSHWWNSFSYLRRRLDHWRRLCGVYTAPVDKKDWAQLIISYCKMSFTVLWNVQYILISDLSSLIMSQLNPSVTRQTSTDRFNLIILVTALYSHMYFFLCPMDLEKIRVKWMGVWSCLLLFCPVLFLYVCLLDWMGVVWEFSLKSPVLNYYCD